MVCDPNFRIMVVESSRGRANEYVITHTLASTHKHGVIDGGQNQKSKRTLWVTMMLHATKRGFKDCPGFLKSTGRLGPKKGRKCYITPAFSGVPNKGNKIRSQSLR